MTGMRLEVERSAAETHGASTTWIVTYPTGSAKPPLHFHPVQRERFTMLTGRMQLIHRDVERSFTTGETLDIMPGEPHAMWNAEGEPAIVRWTTSPALRTERWMGMLLALAAAGQTNAGGVPGLLQLAVLVRAHRDELRLCAPHSVVQNLVLIPASLLGRLRGLRPDQLPALRSR